MSHKMSLSQIFEGTKYPKLVLAVGVIFLLVLELAIFLAASSQSGPRSRIVITDDNGRELYESSGTALTAYEKMVFESNFGPLRDYKAHVESERVPFPYRSWILLAIGIPLGLMFMMFFMVRVWLILLNGDQGERPADPVAAHGGSGFDWLLRASHHISVLHVGFVILLAVLSLWLIPSFLGDVVRTCLAAVREYQLFFAGFSIFACAFLSWIVYLRYRLSKKMLDNRMEIEKFRIETQLLGANSEVRRIEHAAEETDKHPIYLSKTGGS